MNSIDKLQTTLDKLKEINSDKRSLFDFKSYSLEVPNINYSSDEIKNIRKYLCKSSQNLFAKLLGISYKTVQSWESGQSKPGSIALMLLNILESYEKVRNDIFKIHDRTIDKNAWPDNVIKFRKTVGENTEIKNSIITTSDQPLQNWIVSNNY